ncbi:MAG: hypothetical protein HRU20_11015 [Pseudomonadales bacterium]|nr:hypothetical protein [Pseudomonadales bacterium]
MDSEKPAYDVASFINRQKAMSAPIVTTIAKHPDWLIEDAIHLVLSNEKLVEKIYLKRNNGLRSDIDAKLHQLEAIKLPREDQEQDPKIANQQLHALQCSLSQSLTDINTLAHGEDTQH